MEDRFTTYVRTRTVHQLRLKDLPSYDTVKLFVYELKKLGVDGQKLHMLQQRGEIQYDSLGNFKALNPGKIDIDLLEKTKRYSTKNGEITDVHIYMRDVLIRVTIDIGEDELPIYFKNFLIHRGDHPTFFFSVDGFSGRVHTPVCNLKSALRKHLRLDGEKLISLDVRQMQPIILGKVLFDNVGLNPFSSTIEKGKDVYDLLLCQNSSISTREEAKKMLFKLIFGYPMDKISSMFQGDNKWVEWINFFKSNTEKQNPHFRDTHTNLAWLLQSKEVEIMTSAWRRLMRENIPFLTIHDDILVKECHKDTTFKILHEVLSKYFKKFEIVVT